MNAFFTSLLEEQKRKKSALCVGLDPHLDKLPSHMRGEKSQVLPFLKAIVDQTHPYACCYKPQIAYFSAFGLEAELEHIISYIKTEHPTCPVILDAKRNDIGSTAQMYALEAFERYKADAVTLSPYMGGDTIEPFTRHKDKGAFVLCRTSNPGASEFQNLKTTAGKTLYREVAQQAVGVWNEHQNIGLVVGATAIDELKALRTSFPEAWFLVPGVGAQGGDLKAVMELGQRPDGQSGIIVNSARAILYASSGEDFAIKAGEEAQRVQGLMAASLFNKW